MRDSRVSVGDYLLCEELIIDYAERAEFDLGCAEKQAESLTDNSTGQRPV
jgi:hypothetical protein